MLTSEAQLAVLRAEVDALKALTHEQTQLINKLKDDLVRIRAEEEERDKKKLLWGITMLGTIVITLAGFIGRKWELFLK